MNSEFMSFLNEQNTAGLTKCLLHSSKWHLGERAHYGKTQQKSLMAHWLDTFANVDSYTVEKQVEDGTHQCALVRVQKGDELARFAVVISQQNGHIKQLVQLVNPKSVAPLASGSLESWWPTPDPLQLNDFDQQTHLHTTHATMADLTNNQTLVTALTRWWQVWQGADVGHIKSLYQSNAHFALNSESCDSVAAIASLLSKIEGQIKRRYSQLEQVHVQGNIAFVRWRIDGDMHTAEGIKRVRIPLLSVVEFNEQDDVIFEQWLYDTLAFEQRFGFIPDFA